MQETLKYREAFEIYYTMGETRSTAAVAAKVKVNPTTVRKWSRAFNWQEQIILRDKKIGDKVQNKTDTDIISEKAKLLNVTKLAMTVFVDNLKAGNVQINTPIDYQRLVDIYLKLAGEDPGMVSSINIIDAIRKKDD